MARKRRARQKEPKPEVIENEHNVPLKGQWKYSLDERILVEFNDKLYRAVVIKRRIAIDGSPKYLIHYEKYRHRWDEWIDNTEGIPRTSHNLKLMVEENKKKTAERNKEKKAKALARKLRKHKKFLDSLQIPEVNKKAHKRNSSKSTNKPDKKKNSERSSGSKKQGQLSIKRPRASSVETSEPKRKKNKSTSTDDLNSPHNYELLKYLQVRPRDQILKRKQVDDENPPIDKESIIQSSKYLKVVLEEIDVAAYKASLKLKSEKGQPSENILDESNIETSQSNINRPSTSKDNMSVTIVDTNKSVFTNIANPKEKGQPSQNKPDALNVEASQFNVNKPSTSKDNVSATITDDFISYLANIANPKEKGQPFQKKPVASNIEASQSNVNKPSTSKDFVSAKITDANKFDHTNIPKPKEKGQPSKKKPDASNIEVFQFDFHRPSTSKDFVSATIKNANKSVFTNIAKPKEKGQPSKKKPDALNVEASQFNVNKPSTSKDNVSATITDDFISYLANIANPKEKGQPFQKKPDALNIDASQFNVNKPSTSKDFLSATITDANKFVHTNIAKPKEKDQPSQKKLDASNIEVFQFDIYRPSTSKDFVSATITDANESVHTNIANPKEKGQPSKKKPDTLNVEASQFNVNKPSTSKDNVSATITDDFISYLANIANPKEKDQPSQKKPDASNIAVFQFDIYRPSTSKDFVSATMTDANESVHTKSKQNIKDIDSQLYKPSTSKATTLQSIDEKENSKSPNKLIPKYKIIQNPTVFISLEIPEILKERLIDDEFFVNERKMVLQFPNLFNTVAYVINAYIMSKEYTDFEQRAFETGVTILNYFNRIVLDLVMFPHELKMSVRNKGMLHFLSHYHIHKGFPGVFVLQNEINPKKVWGHVFGATHLLRLFNYIPPNITKYINYKKEISIDDLQDFLSFFAENFERFFKREIYGTDAYDVFMSL